VSQRAEEFLDTYAELEKHFRKLLGAENIKSFSVMVKELSKIDRVVNRFRDDLLQWHDLRNAIVHERRGGGQVIAEPIPEALAEFVALAAMLSAPPKITKRFQREVQQVTPDDTIRRATELMKAGGHSQLPVYDGGGLHGLLTATAVTRWLATAWNLGVGPETAVSEVLEQADDRSHWRLLDRNATFIDAIDLFDEAHENGRKLVAILVTHDGKRSQKPVGILTARDIPELLAIY